MITITRKGLIVISEQICPLPPAHGSVPPHFRCSDYSRSVVEWRCSINRTMGVLILKEAPSYCCTVWSRAKCAYNRLTPRFLLHVYGARTQAECPDTLVFCLEKMRTDDIQGVISRRFVLAAQLLPAMYIVVTANHDGFS